MRFIYNFFLVLVLVLSACSEDKKTESGSWNLVDSGTTADLGNIQFPDPSIGYVSGYSSATGSILLKSTDGGVTWARTAVLPDTFLSSICFLDADTGFYAGEYGIIMKTTNGGQSWSRKKAGNGDFWDVTFTTYRIGYASGVPDVYKTTDGGVTWAISLSGANGVSINFLNDTLGLIGTQNGYSTTVNGGTTWSSHSSPTGSGFTDVLVIDPNMFYAVDHAGHFLKSTNGGVTWTVKDLDPPNALRGLWAIDAMIIFVVGDGGQIWQSENGGENWARESSGTTELLDDIGFERKGITGSKGFIVGFNGTILTKHF